MRVLLLALLLSGIASASDYREVIRQAHPGVITNYHQHANLGQGYLIRDDGSRVYFVGLVDDGRLWWWREYPRSRIDAAEVCQSADVVTSLLAAGIGMAEGNPIGLGVLTVKIALNEYAETLPTQECNHLKAALSVAGCGAAGANIATIAIGDIGIASALFGVVAGYVGYRASESYSDCEAWVN